ncbi:hypothetical protein Tco_1074016, partial [Tanacetum coccineum]
TCFLFGHSVDDCPKAHKRLVNRLEKARLEKARLEKARYCPKVIQTSVEVSPKTASSVGKKIVSTSCNSSKKVNMTNATTSCNRICSLSNSFEALNVDDMVTVEVESDNKASTSGVQEEGNSSTPLVTHS